MIRELVHDSVLLSRKAKPADMGDLKIAEDLMETLLFHREKCVGMAANMIGENKAIVCMMVSEDNYLTLFNPVILNAKGEFETEEGCLSCLGGPKKVKRFRTVKIQYQNEKMQTRIRTFSGFPAQIVQHEIDHLNGILI